jgi:hypothetical protein
MKFKKIFATVLAVSILFTSTACIPSKTEPKDEYAQLSETYDIVNKSTNDNIPESFIHGIIRSPEKAQIKVVDSMEFLPDKVLDLYESSNCKIIIIDDKKNNMDYDGRYYPFLNNIYVKKNSALLDLTLYHEIGHMYDFKYYTFKCLSESDEFMDIFESERMNFKTFHSDLDYFRASHEEYFAQAFAEFVKHPRRLKRYCPRTYDYINKYVN